MKTNQQAFHEARIKSLRRAGIFAFDRDGDIVIGAGDADKLYRFSRENGLNLGLRARNDLGYTVFQKERK